MMNKTAKVTLAALLVMASGQVLAADKSDVTVSGSIVPTGCVPTISKGATFDYGSIKASSLVKDDYTVLSVKSLDITVRCKAPMKVAFSGVDARASTVVIPVGKTVANNPTSASNDMFLGLGSTPEGNKIGGYRMWISRGNTNVDGVTRELDSMSSRDGGTTWYKTGSVWVTGTNQYLSTIAAPGTLDPLAFTTLSSQINIQAALNKGAELDLAKIVNLDGQFSLQLSYL